MRLKKTYILHLLVDSESPDHLQGGLFQPGYELQPFQSGAALLALLQRETAEIWALQKIYDRDLNSKLSEEPPTIPSMDLKPGNR